MSNLSATAHELLGIPADFRRHLVPSKNFISDTTQRTLTKVHRELDSIAGTCSTVSIRETNIIPKAYSAFFSLQEISDTTLSLNFNTRRLKRALSYAIAFVPPNNTKKPIVFIDHFPQVLSFLKSNWHTGMLLGLLNCLVYYWRTMPMRHSALIREQLKKAISEYAGKRQDLLSVKKNISLYSDQGGPATCAGSMVGYRVFPSCLFTVNGVPKQFKHSEYCSSFIIEYTINACRNSDFEYFIDEIAAFLGDFQDKAACQLCFSYLAIRADKGSSDIFKQRILSNAVRIAGDPAKTSRWVPATYFTEQEKHSFKEGVHILNRWVSLKLIDIFFEKVTMDRERKKFWQRYYKSIDKIKILGDDRLKYNFLRDDRIRDFVDSRFSVFSYGCSALLMQAKDYMLVEFGGIGNAFYAYKRTARRCPNFDATHYGVNDLKDTSMENLNDYVSQGRLSHNKGWQMELTRWLSAHVGIRID